MPIELKEKKEKLLVSKWITLSFLLSKEEVFSFVDEMEDFFLFRTGKLVESLDSITKEEWKEIFLSSKDAFLLTFDKDDVYAVKTSSGKFLFYPKRPVIQIREHRFVITHDHRIQSMVFGKDSISWGLAFSYPQIFYDEQEKKVVEVFKEKNWVNTIGFKKIQSWVRNFTKPAKFSINGKEVNATFRIGKSCTQQIFES